MLHQKDNCVRSLERKSKSVPEPDKEVAVKQVKCPKCGHINTTDCQGECPECSIIYSQYQLVVKKAFDNTLAIIGRNGLETAGEELSALAIRYPSVKVTCDQYSAFINHALKKYLAGKHDLSHDYFDRLVNKQPVLKDAVAKFLGEKDSVVCIIRKRINKNGVLVSCGLMLIMIVTVMITNIDNSNISTQRKHSVVDVSLKKEKPVYTNTSHTATISQEKEKQAISNTSHDYSSSTQRKLDVSLEKEKPVVSNTSHAATYTDRFLFLMNKYYGNICKVEVNGIFSHTLKVDWTPNTNKLYALKVFAEIGDAKDRLYEEGVRYFQFPNNLCRYNVIDWKTGEKESISDRAPYCFTD